MGHAKPVVQAFTAGADLSARQYCQVKLSDKSTVVICGADEEAVGVLLNAPTSGQMAEVAIAGGTKVKVASTVTLYASVGCGANGVGKDAGTAKKALGKFMDAGVSGDIVPILIDRHTTLEA